MASRKQKVWAGAFVVMTVALLVALVAVINQWNREVTRPFEVHFDPGMSVAGLSNGSRVRFKGVPIGRVETVTLQQGAAGTFAVARLEISDEFARFLTADTRAVLKMEGITGAVSIDLAIPEAARPGGPGGPDGADALAGPDAWLAADVPVIEASTSDLSRILEETPRVIGEIGRFVARLNELYDRNEGRVDGLIARADLALSHAVPRMLELAEDLDRVLSTAERRLLLEGGFVDRLEDSVAAGAGDLSRGVSQVSGAADRMATGVERALARAEEPARDALIEGRIALGEFRALVGEMHALVGANRHETAELLAAMRGSFEALERVLVELQVHPSALVRGEAKSE